MTRLGTIFIVLYIVFSMANTKSSEISANDGSTPNFDTPQSAPASITGPSNNPLQAAGSSMQLWTD